MFCKKRPQILHIFIFTLFLAISSPLLAAPPSSEQIDQLMEVTRTQEIFTSMRASTEANWRSALLAMAQQKHFSAQQQQQLDARMERIIQAIRQEGRWEKTESLYKQVYARHFDSDEIQILINWHRSPTGQAVLNATQKAMQSPELLENPQHIMSAMDQNLSANELAALREFQESDAGKGVMRKSSQAMFEFMEVSLRPIIAILQREMPELLEQP